jgi:DNA-binding NarL/FixJ family response regulator
MITVLYVDGNEKHSALKNALQRQNDVEVIVVSSEDEAAVVLLSEVEIDVIVLSVDCGPLSERIFGRAGDVPVVVATGAPDPEVAREAGRMKSASYIPVDMLSSSAGICAIYHAIGLAETIHEEKRKKRSTVRRMMERLADHPAMKRPLTCCG